MAVLRRRGRASAGTTVILAACARGTIGQTINFSGSNGRGRPLAGRSPEAVMSAAWDPQLDMRMLDGCLHAEVLDDAAV
jgi:hypothetical protein